MPRTDRGHAVSKSAFHEQLRDWIESTRDAIVGSEEVDGRTAWVHVRDGLRMFVLHADTRRASVERYLELVALHGDDLEWTVVPSQRGKMTAVGYGPDKVRHKPFYLYFAAG